MRRWMVILGILIAGVLAFVLRLVLHPTEADSDPDEVTPSWFVSGTESWGLRVVHDAGATGKYFMPQAIGSGCALLDADGDGRLDLYLLHNGGPTGRKNQLFHQDAPGHMREVSQGSGLDVAGHGMGVAVGDVNNDGQPDVLLTEYARIRLFLNRGGLRFEECPASCGLLNPGWATSASFADIDRDGWLDLLVANYVDYDPTWPCTSPGGRPEYCAPKTFPGRVARLFRNRGLVGGQVAFEDITVASGLGTLAGPGLGVLCADFDGDQWVDLFVANDGEANRLWINQRNGKFKDEAVLRGVAYNRMGQTEAGMGVAFGDLTQDGLADLFVTHLTEERHTLWTQGPRGFFTDQTIARGVSRTSWRGTGFGTAMLDVDHDGALDLAIVNGRVAQSTTLANPALGSHWGYYAEKNQLLANDGRGKFSDESLWNLAFCDEANVARGLAYGDLDNDGDLDLVVTAIAGPVRLFLNQAKKNGHHLTIRALERSGKRDAYGAEVRVRVGQRTWLRLVNPGSSFLCSNDPRVHFGLGEATQYDAIEVLWPDGQRETFPGGTCDRFVKLVQGTAPRSEEDKR